MVRKTNDHSPNSMVAFHSENLRKTAFDSVPSLGIDSRRTLYSCINDVFWAYFGGYS